MRQLSRCLPLLVAVALLFVGCDSAPTAPNSNQAQTPNVTTANAGGPSGGTPGGGPAGPAAPGPACDATVTPGESINNAVDNAASGDVVCVESGTYDEQVTINKDLTLKGLNNPTIAVPSDPKDFAIPESSPGWEPIVFAYGGSVDSDGNVSGSATVDVTVKGFTIDGKDQQPNARRLPAVFYRNANGTVSDNTVNNMGIGGKETFGILAYGDSEVDIVGNDIDSYERGGIGASGDGGEHPAPTVKIANNEVTGSTGIGEAWGPNGIQIGFGAEGKIHGNVVEDNRYSESSGVASCILVFESDNVSVKGNTASNCDVGIGVGTWGWFRKTAEGNQIVKNEVSEALFGATLNTVTFSGFTGADPSLRNNKVVNNGFDGREIGITGVRILKFDGIKVTNQNFTPPNFDPSANNNKLIANRISGFDTSVDDGGTDTKVQANDRPFTP